MFGKGLPSYRRWVVWEIRRCDKLRLGEYPWVGGNGNSILSEELKSQLRGQLTRLGYVSIQGVLGKWFQS